MENQFGYFNLGAHTHLVPMSMHKEIRDRVFQEFTPLGLKNACAVFQGGKSLTRNDTDHELLFRQESYFQYLFGVKESNWYVSISLILLMQQVRSIGL